MRANITPLGGGEPEPWIVEQLAHSRGADDGMRRGRDQGLQEGYDHGYKNGYVEGNTAGYNEAIDEGNAVIERMQVQSVTYQNQVAANYQAYEVERDQLRQALVKQATHILALEEQLALRDQTARQQYAKFDNHLAAYWQLKQQSETLRDDLVKLTQQAKVLREENASLNEAFKGLTKTSDEKHLKIQEQSAHYNKTLAFVNAIKGTVESLLEQFPAIENQVSMLFASEYKKAVEFRMLLDEIGAPPHEDSDFELLLPQTHRFIINMLEKIPNRISQKTIEN